MVEEGTFHPDPFRESKYSETPIATASLGLEHSRESVYSFHDGLREEENLEDEEEGEEGVDGVAKELKYAAGEGRTSCCSPVTAAE